MYSSKRIIKTSLDEIKYIAFILQNHQFSLVPKVSKIKLIFIHINF